jgi:hypothetical protein
VSSSSTVAVVVHNVDELGVILLIFNGLPGLPPFIMRIIINKILNQMNQLQKLLPAVPFRLNEYSFKMKPFLWAYFLI